MSDKSESDNDSDNSNTDDGESYSIISETDLETPKMYCSANNWKGQEMIPLMEYLKKHIMRKEFLDEHGLLENDIIVMASDGVWDNLYANHI